MSCFGNAAVPHVFSDVSFHSQSFAVQKSVHLVRIWLQRVSVFLRH